MENGDFELDGYLIGKGQPVFASKFQTGTVADRDQDRDSLFSSTRIFGRDERSAPVWSFEFSVAQATGQPAAAGVLDSLEALVKAWRGFSGARTPGAVQRLRYKVAGRERCVFGRPRNLAFDPSVNLEDGNVVASAQFALQDTLHYSDTLNSVEVRLRQPPTGYVTLPAVWPLISVIESTRQGQFTSNSSMPAAPEEITFYGPISDPKLVNTNWEIGLEDIEIPYDGWVTINFRDRTVLDHTGASRAGNLTRDSELLDMYVHPGPQDLTFSGIDLTATARAVLRWRTAYYSL